MRNELIVGIENCFGLHVCEYSRGLDEKFNPVHYSFEELALISQIAYCLDRAGIKFRYVILRELENSRYGVEIVY